MLTDVKVKAEVWPPINKMISTRNIMVKPKRNGVHFLDVEMI